MREEAREKSREKSDKKKKKKLSATSWAKDATSQSVSDAVRSSSSATPLKSQPSVAAKAKLIEEPVKEGASREKATDPAVQQ